VRPRIALARFFKKLGRFVSSLALMVMRPDDLVEFGRHTYTQQAGLWGSDEMINKGLHPWEKETLGKLPLTPPGKALVLGLGGGREAIALAKMGFSVTGVDFVPEMIDLARANAAKHGVQLEAQVGELSHLAPPPATFDLIWLSEKMYSCIPTRVRRIDMLKKLYHALHPGGWFACTFSWKPIPEFSPGLDRVRKLFAYLSLGNLWYEPGDTLHGEFLHHFREEPELSSEFAAGGFELTHPYLINERERRGIALLRRGA
jgi:SAM-dependent methyltransferase